MRDATRSPGEIRFRDELLEGVLMAFSEAAAQRLGHVLVDGVVSAIRGLRIQGEGCGSEVPHIDSNAISTYLKGGVFAEFVREQVESWALYRLSQMPPTQGAALLESAAHTGNGEAGSIMAQLVRYFVVQ